MVKTLLVHELVLWSVKPVVNCLRVESPFSAAYDFQPELKISTSNSVCLVSTAGSLFCFFVKRLLK